MNTLTEKAYRNLTTLLKMNTTDTFISRRGELLPQEDLVQVDNITDLEYAIYFTYHQLITSSDMGSFLNNGLIKQLDESIENMYDNEQFNEFFGDDTMVLFNNTYGDTYETGVYKGQKMEKFQNMASTISLYLQDPNVQEDIANGTIGKEFHSEISIYVD